MAYSYLVTGGNCVSDRGCTCCVVGFFPRSSKFLDMVSFFPAFTIRLTHLSLHAVNFIHFFTLFTLCTFVVTKK